MITHVQLASGNVAVNTTVRGGLITHRLRVDVPGAQQHVRVRIELRTRSRPWVVNVSAEVPECLRHRYEDGSLCMWWQRHAADRRWVLGDGLEALIHYIEIHLHQEACCRAGLPWPGEQAPGEHPRPRGCATCGGDGP
jgi:hypothetical protein